MIKKKVETYNPEIKGDAQFDTTDTVPLSALLLRYSTCWDKFILTLGIVGSILFGSGMPMLMIFLGEMVDSMGQQNNAFDEIKTQAVFMLYVGLGVALFSFL